MSQPAIVRLNEAFVQIDVPYNAAVSSHRVYASAGPNDPFIFRQSFVPDGVNLVSRHFWNHDEFGFADHGLTKYLIKVTDVIAGIESPLEHEPAFQIPRTTNKLITLLPKPSPINASSMSTVFTPTPFVVSLQHFEAFRLLLDTTVPTAAVEFIVETSRLRTGGTWYPLALAPAGALAFDVERVVHRIDFSESGVHSLNFGDATEIRFLRLSVRKTVAAAVCAMGVQIERAGVEHSSRIS